MYLFVPCVWQQVRKRNSVSIQAVIYILCVLIFALLVCVFINKSVVLAALQHGVCKSSHHCSFCGQSLIQSFRAHAEDLH